MLNNKTISLDSKQANVRCIKRIHTVVRCSINDTQQQCLRCEEATSWTPHFIEAQSDKSGAGGIPEARLTVIQ